jgi:very-short-patch-repair endonuclease
MRNIKVLRFENDVVYRNTNAIVEAIKMHKKTWEEKKDWRER